MFGHTVKFLNTSTHQTSAMTLHTYLPQDRLRAVARGEPLPDRTHGSVLFADISGFTALTEGLRESLGARRGAEELTLHLSTVYTALIDKVERYGGSVISFAGDAMTCWFDDGHGPAAPRAARCALALQEVMQAFTAILLPNGTTTALTLKVAVASGPTRRFIVGDPAIRCIDVLAGGTVDRTSSAEHLAARGEVVTDEATVNALGESLVIGEWREDHETHERFAVLTHFAGGSSMPDLPAAAPPPASDELQVWMHRAVYERERSGQESFLTEFRPCVAVFVRFSGIDYDSNSAEANLDAFIRHTQAIVDRYEGTLMDLTIGDKGSYAYINLGALSVHEDDARRAVKIALEVRSGSALEIQVGITQGILRVGVHGGRTRRTYAALGDEVNLAARLMSSAAAGEILISGHVHKATADDFVSQPRPPLLLKGKAEPLPIFAAIGERQQRAIRLQEPTYALPMVGRIDELQTIDDRLEAALQGQAQIIGIVAEAGMGKSRLVAEVIRLARSKGFAGYGGACRSDAVNTPYQAWKTVWSAFFDVDPSAPLKKQIRSLENEIEERAPARMQAMPLLNIVLDLEIPDNDFIRTLEPQYRKSALTALFEDCLRAAALDEPLLIVVEDLHWIDALSHDLLEELARALSDSRICFVLAYRPPQLARLEVPRLEALPTFTKIELHELNPSEAGQAIRAKLAQLYPARSDAVPGLLVEKLMARSQGNPFYLEELLNFLRDRGLDPRDPADLNKIELPDSLHTLILSRIDQLSEREKTTLRVASIVGRLFRAAWLTGYYPKLGEPARVQADLDLLAEMDITPLDSSEPELAYLFKHILTHEVTYESLPFATRARLHEQLAAYLEKQIAAGELRESSLLDTLVHHYDRSDNHSKQREYLRKAVDAAQEVSAFITAVEYLARLLELTPAMDPSRSALALQLADAHYRLGDFSAARTAIDQAQAAAATDSDRADALAFFGEMMSGMGEYTAAQAILTEAVPLARTSSNHLTLCHALSALGVNYWRLGKLNDARVTQEESLALAHVLGAGPRELLALTRLGLVIGAQGDWDKAERLFSEAHTRAAAAGNRFRAMVALNNLGWVASERKDFASSREYFAQSMALAREIGSQSSIALCLLNLAECDIELGELSRARAGLREGLALAIRLGALAWVVAAVKYFGFLTYAERQTGQALALLGLARSQPAWSGDDQRWLNAKLAEWALDPAVVEAGLAKGVELSWEITIQELLKG